MLLPPHSPNPAENKSLHTQNLQSFVNKQLPSQNKILMISNYTFGLVGVSINCSLPQQISWPAAPLDLAPITLSLNKHTPCTARCDDRPLFNTYRCQRQMVPHDSWTPNKENRRKPWIHQLQHTFSWYHLWPLAQIWKHVSDPMQGEFCNQINNTTRSHVPCLRDVFTCPGKAGDATSVKMGDFVGYNNLVKTCVADEEKPLFRASSVFSRAVSQRTWSDILSSVWNKSFQRAPILIVNQMFFSARASVLRDHPGA